MHDAGKQSCASLAIVLSWTGISPDSLASTIISHCD